MNKIILVGNPNTGKTTLFNTMTKSNEKVSNWHGVTVGEKTKSYKFSNEDFEVTDLPGMYSLEGYSNEEKIARDYLIKNKDSLVVNICDANNMMRNLKLTTELINLGLNVIVVVNMCNECKLFDYEKLSIELGVKIVEIDARKKHSINDLKVIVQDYFENKKTQKDTKLIENCINYRLIIKKCAINNNIKTKSSYKISDKIDKVVLNKFLFLLIFLSIIFLIFYVTFGVIGSCISEMFTYILNYFIGFLRKIINCLNINIIIKTLINNAILDAVVNVGSFLPQIVLLMFFMSLIEDIGFMSRVAFMFDGLLKKVGLTGKSLFSLFMGYGCTTSAVITTRNLENKNLRKRTALLLPFSSCSAKLPVFLVISSLFFNKYKYLFVFLLYLFSISLMLIFACIYKRFIPQSEDVFVLEMPKYRLPNLSKILKDIWSVIKEFFIKIGTILIFFNVIVWFLQNFTFRFEFLNGVNFEKSILYNIAKILTPVFSIIGLGNVGIIVAILLGIIAKEMVVVGLAMINGVSGSMALLQSSLLLETSVCSFTPISSIVFLVFVLIYSPCISALATIKNELGIKTMIYVFVFQFLLAFLVSFIVYKTLQALWLLVWFGVFIILDILVRVVIKSKKKKICRGNCCACRKI